MQAKGAADQVGSAAPFAWVSVSKPIAELLEGDIVLAYNEEMGEVGNYPIVATFEHLDPEIVLLTIDGELIETTPEHPFYVIKPTPRLLTEGEAWQSLPQSAGRWVDAGALTVGEHVWRADGSTGAVESVEVVAVEQWMYNLTVDVAHTFFVGHGAWLVHNTGPCTPKLHRSSLIPDELDALNNTLEKIRNGKTDGLHRHVYKNEGGLLPEKKGVEYMIYDVASPVGETGRGARRVVTGSDGSVYYTNSHYGDTGGTPFYQVK